MKNKIILYIFSSLIFIGVIFFSLSFLSAFFSRYNKSKNYNLENLKNKRNIIPLAILGSGPAGLSAAIYAARSGVNTVVFTGPNPGGQLKDGILVENWPGVNKDSGANIMNNLERQARDFGAIIINKSIDKIDFSSWPFKLGDYWALSVIIATGAAPKRLGTINEDKYWIKGILSCPLCDAHLIKNKSTVVIGGGDSAVERIIQLAPYAKDITLIVRTNKIRAIYDMYKKIKDFPHVKILFNKEIENFEGSDKKLTGINLIDTKTGIKSNIQTKWVFLSIGFQPNSDLFKNYLDLDQEGYIKHNPETQETNIKGIFVAGNVSDKIYKQASTASGDGTKAAANAVKFLSNFLINKEAKNLIKENSYQPNQEKGIKVEQITSLDQLNNIIKTEKNVVIECYSPLCSSCKAVESIISNLAYKYKDKIKIFKIDILKNKQIIKEYNITLIPEFLLFKDGKLIDRKSELLNQDQISDFINAGFNL